MAVLENGSVVKRQRWKTAVLENGGKGCTYNYLEITFLGI